MKKIIIITYLFFTTIATTFSFDTELILEKDNLSLGDLVKLKLEVLNISVGESILVEKIPGIENFSVISSAKSKEFYSKQIVINGELKEKNNYSFFVNFVLKPKRYGNFEIGPVSLFSSGKTEKTNSVNLKVIKEEELLNINNNINNFKDIENKNFFIIENIIKTIIIFIVVVAVLYIIIISKKDKKKENNKDDNEKNIKLKELRIPETSDKNFTNNLEKYIKYILQKRYNFDGKNLDIKEMIINYKINERDREKLNKIIENIDKIKYSNLVCSKKDLLEQVKNL